MHQPPPQGPPPSSHWGPAAAQGHAPHYGAPGAHHGQHGAYGAYGHPHAAYGYSVTSDPRLKSLADRSTTWLIVAIAGFWLGFWLITGPLCWIMAGRVRREYRALGLAPSGNATGAWIIGIVSSVFSILALVAVMGIIAAIVLAA